MIEWYIIREFFIKNNKNTPKLLCFVDYKNRETFVSYLPVEKERGGRNENYTYICNLITDNDVGLLTVW